MLPIQQNETIKDEPTSCHVNTVWPVRVWQNEDWRHKADGTFICWPWLLIFEVRTNWTPVTCLINESFDWSLRRCVTPAAQTSLNNAALCSARCACRAFDRSAEEIFTLLGKSFWTFTSFQQEDKSQNKEINKPKLSFVVTAIILLEVITSQSGWMLTGVPIWMYYISMWISQWI